MALFISLISAFFVLLPIYLISSAITGSKKRQEKALEKAIAQRHVLKAVLKKTSTFQSDVPGRTGFVCQGTYEYEYKGKRYKYRSWAHTHPATLTLYFIKNPRKASPQNAIMETSVNWPLAFLIVTLIIYWYVITG